MNASIAAHESCIEIELVRLGTNSRNSDALQWIERDLRRLAVEPGFVNAGLHLSNDAMIVACIQWSDE